MRAKSVVVWSGAAFPHLTFESCDWDPIDLDLDDTEESRSPLGVAAAAVAGGSPRFLRRLLRRLLLLFVLSLFLLPPPSLCRAGEADVVVSRGETEAEDADGVSATSSCCFPDMTNFCLLKMLVRGILVMKSFWIFFTLPSLRPHQLIRTIWRIV